MGNKSSCIDEEDLVDENPLTKSEREALRKKYNELIVVGKSVEDNKIRFLAEFESQEIPNFALSVYNTCKTALPEAQPSFQLFQKFAIGISRSTSSNILRKVWDLVCVDHSLAAGHSRTTSVLRLVLECSLCERQHLAATAARMTEHLEYLSSSAANRNKHRDNGGVVEADIESNKEADSETELAGFIDWVNEYAPHTAKVIVSATVYCPLFLHH